MAVLDILTGLCSAYGPSGAEGSASRLLFELLGDYFPVHVDTLGNVIAEGGSPRGMPHVMLDAHVDEICMVVTYIDDDGFLYVDRCGAPDRRVLPGAEVVVLGSQRITGVVCTTPPHLAKDRDKIPDFSDIRIDIGCTGQTAKNFVPIGSRVVSRVKPYTLLGKRFTGRALDNRVGVAAVIRCVELLNAGHIACRLSVVLSTREEVGGQGAGCAAFDLAPTHAIAVDAGFASQPGVTDAQSGKLGAGPMIGASPVLDSGVTADLRKAAEQSGIAYQHDVCGGRTGTNADNIALTRGGVKCGLVSVPIRNMHTTAEVCDLDDVENTARLLAAYIRSL